MERFPETDDHDLDRITRRFKRVRRCIDVLIVVVVVWMLGRSVSPKLAEAMEMAGALAVTGGLVILWIVHWHTLRQTRAEDIERIRHLTMHDGLTEVYNVRYLKQRIDQEIHRAKRYHHSFCLLYMDLDHFKQVNDTYGHKAGDKVLIAVAEMLRDTCRSTDMVGRVVGRIGGDEFLLVTPETDAAGAACLARRVLKIVNSLEVDIGGDQEVDFVGASIGIAEYPSDAEEREALLEVADAAMYRAKSAGSNCFAHGSEEVVRPQEQEAAEAR